MITSEMPKEVAVLNQEGKEIEKIVLPSCFRVPVRKDLIKRAFIAEFTASLQPKGRDPMAGKRTTAVSWGPGYGIARIPRLSNGEARLAPNVVGGRRAFPPLTSKKVVERINKKEKMVAICSALSATTLIEMVRNRGHIYEGSSLPMIVNKIPEFKKTRELYDFLLNLGLEKEIERVERGVKIRAGKGKMRGRRLKKPKSVLIVTSDISGIFKVAKNIPGIDVVLAKDLSIIHLAPGGVPGRLTIFEKQALSVLDYRLRGVIIEVQA